MELGDSTTAERDQRSVVDEALDKLKDDLAELVKAVETGGLDHLDADQQLTVWQRFERLRNKLLLCRYHHTHFLQTAGAAASMTTGYPNGSRPAGSTKINDPTSTPASDASTPNNDSTAATNSDEHPPPHNPTSPAYIPCIFRQV
jgi:hypothetical protein